MPKQIRGKGFLKNTRFKGKQQRNVTRRAKREGMRQKKLTEQELHYATYEFLKLSEKYTPIEVGKTQFENVYDSTDAISLSYEFAEETTKPSQVKKQIYRSLKPGVPINLRSLLILLLFVIVPTTDAAVKFSFSVGPEDTSLWDVASIGTSIMSKTAKYLETPMTMHITYPSRLGLNEITKYTSREGSVQRELNNSSGIHPIIDPKTKLIYDLAFVEAHIDPNFALPFTVIRYTLAYGPTVLKYSGIFSEEQLQNINDTIDYQLRYYPTHHPKEQGLIKRPTLSEIVSPYEREAYIINILKEYFSNNPSLQAKLQKLLSDYPKLKNMVELYNSVEGSNNSNLMSVQPIRMEPTVRSQLTESEKLNNIKRRLREAKTGEEAITAYTELRRFNRPTA